jgi:hypothetical protein
MVWLMFIDVSEESASSIFRAEGGGKRFEAITTMATKETSFSDATLCVLVEVIATFPRNVLPPSPDRTVGQGSKACLVLILFFYYSWYSETDCESTWYCGLSYQPQMIDDGDCGAIGGMKIGRGNRSTRRKPAPVPLCPPQIPHDLNRARTRAAAVGSQRLTA